jgi:hypothetical protein
MAEDVTQIVNLGGCSLWASTNNFSTYTDLGNVDEGGVKVEVKTSTILAKVAAFGDTPVAGWINGQVAKITAKLSQSQYVILQQILPGVTITTGSSGKSNATLGVFAGTPLTPFSLKLKSLLAALTPLFDVTAVNVIVTGAFDIGFTGKKEQLWSVEFAVLVNQNAVNGANLLTIGDTTITQQSAVTLSSVVPNINATGVATSAVITWTFSGTLQAQSVSSTGPTPTVGLIESTASSSSDAGNLKAGTAVLTNNGSSTTVVFTPTAAMTASAVYTAFITGLVDTYGNVLPMYTTTFTI